MICTRSISTRLHPALPPKTSMRALASDVSHREPQPGTIIAHGSPSSPHGRSWTSPMMASLQYIRALKLPRRLPSRLQLNFDLAREGDDFSTWMVTALEGLSQVRYKAMRQALEDGLSPRCSTKLLSAQSEQGAHARIPGSIPPKVCSATLGCPTPEVVALHDGGLGGDGPLQCSFVFFYPVGQDPTSILPSIRQGNCSFKSISKLVPVTEAMRGAVKCSPDAPFAVDPGLTRPPGLSRIDPESHHGKALVYSLIAASGFKISTERRRGSEDASEGLDVAVRDAKYPVPTTATLLVESELQRSGTYTVEIATFSSNHNNSIDQQHLWSSGYDSRLGCNTTDCERSQVRVLAGACSFAQSP